MPITLYTGLPGHGKTSLMVEQLLAEAKKGERPIYAHGIDGLEPGLASEFDPRRWHEPDYLADGALIFVDEAWKWFGGQHDASRAPAPPHVLALAEHRHRGFDFVFTTQAPIQLYTFARSMVADHHHVVRRFGTKILEVFTWSELNDDVKSSTRRENALRKTRALPEKAWAAYKSASVHTIKARIPFRVIMIPLCVLAFLALGFFAYQRIKPSAMAGRLTGHEAAASGTDAPPTSTVTGKARAATFTTAAEYADQFTPMIPTAPWTAKAYASRAVQADPTIACMYSAPGLDANGHHAEGGCHCLTEQGTKYNLPEQQCRFVVDNGGVYNPFKAPAQEQFSREGDGGNKAADSHPKATPPDAVQPVAAASPRPEDRS